MSESAVQLRSAASGRTLTVDSDQPGVQIYTGNWLASSPLNKSGRSYNDYDGVAIEMQGFPDAPEPSPVPHPASTPWRSTKEPSASPSMQNKAVVIWPRKDLLVWRPGGGA